MKEDRRIRKTKSAIKKAFIQLLKEKDLDKITVQDISNQADINRGTFYLHYEDKYTLLSDMEDEYISEIWSLSQFNHFNASSPENIADEFINNTLTKILQHIADNIDFYHTILQLNRKSKLEDKIYFLIKENMQKYISVNHEIDGIPEMYFHSYVAGATISTIKYWVQDDNRITVDELTQHIFKIVYNGPLRIMAENHYARTQTT
ncbi:TetR-like C-terminal domain-containing protein [Staphylococcus sp. NRL 16/872]|uniref:TetR/AcrR family transcriptional regulator n=1 Tax=Staphylococcus sp. NRL 16/872 TaxID=2930131 RepID=UPI001FB4F30C|nr:MULTISPECIES: TetR/AcrR family transcriptional regulator [unclassified Staphylococcus]MCJ1655686.1 TetR/AcrR family transcriptional regulator [Staphylococcus sp. NRL 21/187]MCJ1661503.1 TetR/AcrR family transcriptional regulator [Staphylococcus sp. NRL 18/288]MCJ1667415.1 TetR/AcrR family transcriptional regulator [Staphylococcus sp. NRL 19/737]WEN69897.1 TetR-like C-terminal domain-containing protein [Staphylococcus sp. NRL 16/872]